MRSKPMRSVIVAAAVLAFSAAPGMVGLAAAKDHGAQYKDGTGNVANPGDTNAGNADNSDTARKVGKGGKGGKARPTGKPGETNSSCAGNAGCPADTGKDHGCAGNAGC
jgi:hypothetical protein